MQSITSTSFYGNTTPPRPELQPSTSLDQRIELKHRQTSLLSPSRTWRVFERQDEALNFARERGNNGLMTFVFHAKSTLQRHFLVAHPREYWLHQINQDIKERCSYEIIPELVTCKLYLDLEFEYEFNPTHNGITMTELFIKIIAYKFLTVYHLKVDRSMILDLDSSTEKKFSRHLIYQIPFLSFANNYQVGIFIRDICALIRGLDEELRSNLGVTSEELRQLLIKDRHGKEKLFCDEGVYTKNRHFRMYGCTKPHKNSYLVKSPENMYTVHLKDVKLQEEAIFLASLITNFEPLDIVVPLPELKSNQICKYPSNNSGTSAQAKGFPSPFPCLDTFARDEMISEGLRCWLYFSSTQRLIYEAQRPGFCANVGRVHKSNKGMLVIDLHNNNCYRKCHDPDCSGFQSMPKALPSHVVTSMKYPECSESDSKEIREVLEFLESHDDEQNWWEPSEWSSQSSQFSQSSPSSQLASQLGHLTVGESSRYQSEIQDMMHFLSTCNDF